jgi:hypothetical protein
MMDYNQILTLVGNLEDFEKILKFKFRNFGVKIRNFQNYFQKTFLHALHAQY